MFAQHVKGSSSLADQLQAVAVDSVNQARKAAEDELLVRQGSLLDAALREMQKVRDFIGAPEKILGREDTKHGEIAEQVEVGVRRAKDALTGRDFSATFEGVGRTAPADYLIDGIEVQSKFINGVNNSLSHVLKHMEKYSQFGRDGSFYHLPKDQHELVSRLLRGEEVPGLSEKSVRAILGKVTEIEKLTGVGFQQAVQPGISNYADVQQGKVVETLDQHEQSLQDQNKKINEQIKLDHEASLADAAKATAGAAAVGAAVSLATGLINKYRKEGKNPLKGQLTWADWKELGFETSKGGAIGAVTGGAIYALTNCASMSAPLAGSFVSAVKGMAPLIAAYKDGTLSLDELLDQGTLVCSDVALVGLCSVAGQALVPVPILGALIGSIAGKVLSSVLGSQVAKAAQALETRSRELIAALDKAYQDVLRQITNEFDRLGDLAKAVFDVKRNENLIAHSATLARALGVPEKKLIKSKHELLDFMAS